MEKPASTQIPIEPALAYRWSARAIDPQKPVSQADQLRLFEAARWAPSCFGEEPWRYLIWDRFRDEPSWRRACDCLTPKNQAWAGKAPLLMLSLADPVFAHNGKPNRWAQHDVGAASENLCVQAVALGLVSHQMAGFDAARIMQEFALPENLIPLAMIAVGHPGDPATLDADQQAKELGPRRRKPLAENFFANAWAMPLELNPAD